MATLGVAVTLAIPAVLVFLFLPFSALNKVLTSEATSARQRKLAPWNPSGRQEWA